MSAKSLLRSVLLAALAATQFTQLGCVPFGVTSTIVDPSPIPLWVQFMQQVVANGGT